MMRFSRAIARPALASTSRSVARTQARGLVVASQTARAKEAPVSLNVVAGGGSGTKDRAMETY
jgi:hypothetical protein